MYILALDNGTQSIRALLFDLQGNLVEKVQIPIIPYYSHNPGWAEQDADYFWDKICDACQKLWQQTAIPKESIACVTLTTQRATVVMVGKDGKPLRPAFSWLDKRRTEGLKPVGGLWGLAFKTVGMSDTVARLQADTEANWVARYEPEIWAKTYKYLLLSGYLTYRLTGRFVDSIGSQVGYIPFDYKRLTWSRSYDWKWQTAPVDPSMLPEIIAPAHPLGQITTEAAQATGIPAGLTVIAAAADKACEVLGSGGIHPHIGSISYGTTATINTTHKQYIEIIPLIPPYPAAMPDAYSLELQVFRGYWLVDWFKKEFGYPEVQFSPRKGVPPEMLFEQLLDDAPPGADGLILQPYWTPGIKVPGPEARGTIIGFSDIHTRAHVYRAILEGVAYAMRDGKEQTERRTKIPITELRVSGGGSQSDGAMQLTADIFNLPTSRPHTYETSGLGAAIDGAVGMGYHSSFETAIKEMTRMEHTFEPNLKNHEIYEQFYGVYKRLYRRVKPLYQQIRSIMYEVAGNP